MLFCILWFSFCWWAVCCMCQLQVAAQLSAGGNQTSLLLVHKKSLAEHCKEAQFHYINQIKLSPCTDKENCRLSICGVVFSPLLLMHIASHQINLTFTKVEETHQKTVTSLVLLLWIEACNIVPMLLFLDRAKLRSAHGFFTSAWKEFQRMWMLLRNCFNMA